MSKRTYLPLLMDRWTAGTQELTFEERGFYISLLVWMYDTGRPVKDSDHAALILRCDKRTSRRLLGKLRPKFRPTSAGLRHKLLDNLLRNGGKIKGLDANSFPTVPDPVPDPEEEKDTLSPKPPFSAKKPKAKQAYPDAFEALWITRPKRAGGDDKKRACQAWSARISEGNTQEIIQAGVDRYRVYCDGTGKTGTEYVKQMATFLGPADPPHFTEDWAIPQNGNGGNNGSDYDKPIRGSFDWYAERDKRRQQERERLDGRETGEILGSDDGVVWEKLED